MPCPCLGFFSLALLAEERNVTSTTGAPHERMESPPDLRAALQLLAPGGHPSYEPVSVPLPRSFATRGPVTSAGGTIQVDSKGVRLADAPVKLKGSKLLGGFEKGPNKGDHSDATMGHEVTFPSKQHKRTFIRASSAPPLIAVRANNKS